MQSIPRPECRSSPQGRATCDGDNRLIEDLRAEVRELRAALLRESDRRDRELAARLEWFRDGYGRGFEAGREVGYGQAHTELERAWQSAARRVARGAGKAVAP